MSERVCFSFQSKDRPNFTRESISSVLVDDGPFDLIWVDGSQHADVPNLACELQRTHPRIRSVEFGIHGGPDAAIQFALRQQLEMGYDYVGLIENDVVLQLGWYSALQRAISLACADNLPVGAASCRGYQSRVLEYRHGYSVDWAVGAGMLLLTREAAKILLDNYHQLEMSVGGLYCFYANKFHRRIRNVEWPHHHPDTRVSLDYAFAAFLYHHDLYSVGAIPSMATDLQFEVRSFLGTDYVTLDQDNAGHVFPPIADFA